jgi:hypothetical protein
MKFKIELINIGRDKYNGEKVVNTKDIHDAEKIALKKVRMHLLSQNVALVPQNNSYGYNVIAGFHNVGLVKIFQIKKMPKGLTAWEKENWREQN